ncbi:MAG: hypothetical protein GF344_17135, partial [Chitinivibrionales bacterium]|nr:hypothetical protein [Chitinivibrionales bacterium]MBD3358407.1 hypothetical protein [Chitinivibrionales bacterium]
MIKSHYLFAAVGLLLSAYSTHGQESIEIDLSKVKFERNVNPTGYCLSFISDFQNPSPQKTFAQAIIDSRVGSLRFPMGTLADNYLWQTPGEYDNSSNGLNHRVATQSKNPGSWSDVNSDGTFKDYVMDFDEFVALCRETGTEPVVMVNALGHLHKNSIVNYEQLKNSAVEWVKYANVTRDYNVKYWEIGNEVDIHMNRADYIDLLKDFSASMKAVDSTIKIGAGLCWKKDWMVQVVDSAADYLDFMVVHEYQNETEDYADYKEENGEYIKQVKKAISAIDNAPAGKREKIELLITEYNGGHSSNQSFETDRNALYKALVNFEKLLNMVTCDRRLTYTHFWVTHSPWGDRLDVSSADAFTYDNELTALGYSQMIAGRFIKPQILDVERVSGYVRGYAALNSQDSALAIWLVNKNDTTEDACLTVSNAPGLGHCRRWEFTGDSATDPEPSWDSVAAFAVSSNEFTVSLKPFSITVLELRGGEPSNMEPDTIVYFIDNVGNGDDT